MPAGSARLPFSSPSPAPWMPRKARATSSNACAIRRWRCLSTAGSTVCGGRSPRRTNWSSRAEPSRRPPYIADSIKERRGHRDYLQHKYYMRLVARLAPVSKAQAQRVPTFNPLKLYANSAPLGDADRARPAAGGRRQADRAQRDPAERGRTGDGCARGGRTGGPRAGGRRGERYLWRRAAGGARATGCGCPRTADHHPDQDHARAGGPARRLRWPGAASREGAEGRYAGAHSGAVRRAVLASAHDDRCRAPDIPGEPPAARLRGSGHYPAVARQAQRRARARQRVRRRRRAQGDHHARCNWRVRAERHPP